MIKKFDIKKQVFLAKSLERLLEKVIIPELINNPNALYSSRKMDVINLSFRELFGLTLICYLGEYLSGRKWVPSSDPDGRDGFIVCLNNGDPVGIPFEQVMVTKFSKGSLEDSIVRTVGSKSLKGKPYATGYGLIIFSDKNGEILIPRLSKKISPNPFESCWLISKLDENNLTYLICLMKSNAGDPLGEYVVDLDLKTKIITVGHAPDVLNKKARR